MRNLDLFGGETDIDSHKHPSQYQYFKITNNYRKADGEEKCGRCRHHTRTRWRRIFHKCRLMGISNSVASDIRVGHICNKFEKEEK